MIWSILYLREVYVHDHEFNYGYKYVAFTAMLCVIPWLRVLELFRFYV